MRSIDLTVGLELTTGFMKPEPKTATCRGVAKLLCYFIFILKKKMTLIIFGF